MPASQGITFDSDVRHNIVPLQSCIHNYGLSDEQQVVFIA